MRQLTDNLAALGPAAERNDLSEVRSRLDSARGSAAQISGGLAGAATTMSQGSLIRTQFQAAADAGGVLRDTLDDLNGKLGGAQPPDEEAGARLQQSVTEFNAAVERVSLACSNHFSAAVVEPTTSVPPTRTTR